MEYRKIQLPREIHTGPGIIEETGAICRDLRFKGKVLVVTGTNTYKIGGEDVIRSLGDHGFDVEDVTIKQASVDIVSEIRDMLGDKNLFWV